jgi:sugar diacid utilization regulator
MDKMCSYALSQNPNAIHLIEQTLDYVNWYELSKNPNAMHLIAPLDHLQMKENNREFFEELVSFVCHPNWLNKCASRLNMDFLEYQTLLMECGVF